MSLKDAAICQLKQKSNLKWLAVLPHKACAYAYAPLSSPPCHCTLRPANYYIFNWACEDLCCGAAWLTENHGKLCSHQAYH